MRIYEFKNPLNLLIHGEINTFFFHKSVKSLKEDESHFFIQSINHATEQKFSAGSLIPKNRDLLARHHFRSYIIFHSPIKNISLRSSLISQRILFKRTDTFYGNKYLESCWKNLKMNFGTYLEQLNDRSDETL